MQPGRAVVFLALLGISMVPLIVAPPETSSGATETTDVEIEEENIDTTSEPLDDYSTLNLMKRSVESRDNELQKAIKIMSKGQQFQTSSHETVTEKTEGLIREALQMLEEVKPYEKRLWLEDFSYFIQNMLSTLKKDKKYKKSNTSIENLSENFLRKEILLPINESPVSLATANIKHQESNAQEFTIIPPQLGRDGVPILPNISTQTDKDTVTDPESIDYSLHSPSITSSETSNFQESRPIPESPKPKNTLESQAIHTSTETYIPQKSREITVFSEAYSPQESQAMHLSSETNIRQESQEAHKTSETNTSHETQSRNISEDLETNRNRHQSSSSKPQPTEEHLLPHLSTPQVTVPESNQMKVVKLTSRNQANFPKLDQVFPILDPINHLKFSKLELINNHVEEIDDIDELENELLELSSLKALESSQNSSLSVKASDMSPSTTTIKRNTFQLSVQKPESTVGGDLQKSPTLPQISKENPVMISETFPDHAVPGTSHQLTIPVTSEAQSTLPKKERDIPMHDPLKLATPEEDELERELRELHWIAAAKHLRSTPTPFVNTIDQQLQSTPATTEKRSSFVTDYQAATEDEKRRIEINIAKEIHELHNLGAKQEEIIEALGVNRQELPDGLELVKIGQDAEIHDVQDSNADGTMAYKTKPNAWKPFAHTSSYSSKPYINDSFERMHISIPPLKERVITNKLRDGYHWDPYNAQMRTDSRNIQNTLRKLQRENYALKTRLMSFTQTNGNTHKTRGVTFSGPNPQNQFLPLETRYPTKLSLVQKFQNVGGTPIYTPYPYFANTDLKNYTLQGNVGKTSSLVSKTLPHNDNSEFSDEMKRELRDGKVILLSDSVVRSNFENEKERDEAGKETKAIPLEVGETGIQAQN